MGVEKNKLQTYDSLKDINQADTILIIHLFS